MTLDNMTGITKGSYTGFCKSQLITCNRVKECNGVCPFEDALKHADKKQVTGKLNNCDDSLLTADEEAVKERKSKLDLISRQTVIEELAHIMCDHPLQGYEDEQLLINAVKSLPSADRPTGEWINREKCQVDEDAYEVAICSECGAEITIEYPHDNYCPSCGAKMGERRTDD